jgi:hypothetical protein
VQTEQCHGVGCTTIWWSATQAIVTISVNSATTHADTLRQLCPCLSRRRRRLRRRCSPRTRAHTAVCHSCSVPPSSWCTSKAYRVPPSRSKPAHLPAVRRWIGRYEEKQDVADAPRSGGPRCTDDALDTAIAGASRCDPFAAPRALKRSLNLDVSDDTIRRRLDEAGLHARVARHAYPWSEEHIRQRLSFANGYSWMTEADWSAVLFCDVSTFLGAGYHGKAYVRREDGTANLPEQCLDQRPHPVSVTAWGLLQRERRRLHADV